MANDALNTRQDLSAKSVGFKGQVIDKEKLVRKIKQTVATLENAPIEARKPVYSNLIQFTEIHPNRIKMGVIASSGGSTTVAIGALRGT